MPEATAVSCPKCARPWTGGLDFNHEPSCSYAVTEKIRAEMDAERLTPGADLVRDASSTETLLAQHIGAIHGTMAPFQRQGEPATIAEPRSIVVRLVDGQRRRVSIDGVALPMSPQSTPAP